MSKENDKENDKEKEIELIDKIVKQIKNKEINEREIKSIFRKYAEGEQLNDTR